MPPMLECALALAARGFRVIPLYDPGPKGKRPRIDNWVEKATASPAQIVEWWTKWPNSNVGAAMGGPERVIAIDVDGAKGGFSSWTRLLEMSVETSLVTLQSESGSRNGSHLFFSLAPHHDLARIKNAIEFRPGLDVRSEGGQVVLPPSVHETGNRYEWCRTEPIAPLPDWLYDLIATVPVSKTPVDVHEPTSTIPLMQRIEAARAAVLALPPAISGQGGHNSLLVAATTAYRGFDLPRAAAELVLEDYNRTCAPPWSPAEIAHKLSAVETNERVGEHWGYLLEVDDMAAALAPDDAPRAPTAQASGIHWMGTAELAKPLVAPNWVVKELQICPGRATMLAGYGASGKTLIAQSLLLAFAAGKPIWNNYTPGGEGGRVVRHFDHEQGTYATVRRYQRLAKGLGVPLGDPAVDLAVACFPEIGLDIKNAREAYARACAGANLVLIDALRGAAPSEDENDSKIRRCIDHLGWVSERIGCAFILIHHAGKTATEDKRAGPRGSSAIFDGCGAVFQISAEDLGAPKQIYQTKPAAESEGGLMAPFQLSIEDDASSALVVRYRSFDAPQTSDEILDARKAEVLMYVEAHPGTSQVAIKLAVKGKGEVTSEAIQQLLHATPWQLVNRKSNPGKGVPMALFTRNNDRGNLV